ncbi:ABC transporter ATP-binding protein [Patescibacteria group bacterium]|nr:ABC transporter ATP-binding protein [Patescibacteria group bacterium]
MVELKEITKTYQMGEQKIDVLKKVCLTIKSGEFSAIMGPSGSGKSTLMNIIGMLDTPTSGQYCFEGGAVEKFNETELTKVRSRKIGFVFQQYNLLPRMSALKQVMVPLMYQGVSQAERRRRAHEALSAVGLGDRIASKPNELSGGQQQRVSIARAIVTNPSMILADEPTGALDTQTGEDVMRIFKKLNDDGKAIILITHESNIAEHASRLIHIVDGIIQN